MFISVLLCFTFGEIKVNSSRFSNSQSKEKKDEFTTSLDLLYPKRHQELPPKNPDDKILRFFVIGDFGAYMKYRELSAVTDAMNDLAGRYDFNHTVTVGDNLYWFGIENINNRWKAWLIMSVFKKSALKNIMIYPTLGNHDWYVDYFNEVLYSKYDYQWRMDNDYYVRVTPLKDNPEKQFVNIMLNSCKTICPKGVIYQYDNTECTKFSLEPGGAEIDAHYSWIDYQLEKYSQDPKTAWIALTMHHQPFLHPGMKQALIPLTSNNIFDNLRNCLIFIVWKSMVLNCWLLDTLIGLSTRIFPKITNGNISIVNTDL